MLDHFAECIKQAKGVRQQAVQLNIFTAVLSALKVRKTSFKTGLAGFILQVVYTIRNNPSVPSCVTEGFG